MSSVPVFDVAHFSHRLLNCQPSAVQKTSPLHSELDLILLTQQQVLILVNLQYSPKIALTKPHLPFLGYTILNFRNHWTPVLVDAYCDTHLNGPSSQSIGAA